MLFGKKKKDAAASGPNLWQRLRQGLNKTRTGIFSGLSGLIKGGTIDPDTLEEIENRLLTADVGVESTSRIVEALQQAVRSGSVKTGDDVMNILRDQMLAMLKRVEVPLVIEGNRPFVILVVGVNGVGKTTTIGKLAHYLLQADHSVLIAAGDTFRAAAIEQLQTWGERNDVPVIAQRHGADAAAVVYDAMAAARARSTDVVIADTAGRLHTKENLMAEMQKIRRTIGRFDPDLPVETLLVVDAGTGQNAIAQAQQFDNAVGVDGLVLTKLDGSARGGILFALAEKFGKPLRFIGVGEQLEDLQPFSAEGFVDALLAADS